MRRAKRVASKNRQAKVQGKRHSQPCRDLFAITGTRVHTRSDRSPSPVSERSLAPLARWRVPGAVAASSVTAENSGTRVHIDANARIRSLLSLALYVRSLARAAARSQRSQIVDK